MSIPSSKPIFPLHVLNSNPAPPTSDTASDLHLVVPSPNLHASNPPPLCCSSRLKNLHPNTNALLTKFLPLSNSHDLLPLSVADPSLSVDLVLSALADSSMEPAVDTGDDPSWTEALASLEREYWVVGAREELQSLQDMQVFVLVPHSSLPPGRRPLKGKLVCKCKRDDSGKIICYKVWYVAKGYAQQYSMDYDKTTALTAHLELFCLILHIAASLRWACISLT